MSSNIRFYIFLAVVFVLFGLGMYLIEKFGAAKMKQGEAAVETKVVVAAVKENVKAVKELDRTQRETNKKTDSDIDVDLRSLGIMRDDKDR